MDSQVLAINELNVAGLWAEIFGLLLVLSVAFTCARRPRAAERRTHVLLAQMKALQDEHSEALGALKAQHEAALRDLQRSIVEIERTVESLDTPLLGSAPTGNSGASTLASEEAAMGRTTTPNAPARTEANDRLASATPMPTQRNLRRSVELETHECEFLSAELNACLDNASHVVWRASLGSAPTGPPGASTSASDAVMALSAANRELSAAATTPMQHGTSPHRSSHPSDQESDPTAKSGPRARNTRTASSTRMEASDSMAPPTPMRRHGPSRRRTTTGSI